MESICLHLSRFVWSDVLSYYPHFSGPASKRPYVNDNWVTFQRTMHNPDAGLHNMHSKFVEGVMLAIPNILKLNFK